jgi:hypothetical protein
MNLFFRHDSYRCEHVGAEGLGRDISWTALTATVPPKLPSQDVLGSDVVDGP